MFSPQEYSEMLFRSRRLNWAIPVMAMLVVFVIFTFQKCGCIGCYAIAYPIESTGLDARTKGFP